MSLPKKPGLPKGPIEPFDVAWACHLYETMTPFAASLDRLRAARAPSLDLGQEAHRCTLLQFLNDWGCRNLAKEWHGLAAEELNDWFSTSHDQLPPANASFLDLDEAQRRALAKVFDALATRVVAKRTRSGRQMLVTFGPTAASKSLFALRPHSLPAWDAPMRRAFGHLGTGASFIEFATDVQDKIAETEHYCESHGFDLRSLQTKLGRPSHTTVHQLIVEYYWITITRGVPLPTRSALREWLSWCD